MIAPAQLRAARALLDWGRKDLQDACGISAETIKNIEYGKFRPHKATLEKILQTFSMRGIEFMGQNRMQGVMLFAASSPDAGQEARS